MKKEHFSLFMIVAGVFGVFIIIGLSTGYEYTGLQAGKPNLQVSSVWMLRADKSDIFGNNLVNVRICNSGTSDLVSKYTIRLVDFNDNNDFAESEGKPIRVGLCHDYSFKFNDFNFYNKRNIEVKAFADSENNIDELDEKDNTALAKFDLLEFTPNLKINGVDVKGDKFYGMKVDAEICNIPGSAMVDVKTSFNAEFTINGVKRTVAVNEKIPAHGCLNVKSPDLNDFNIVKSNTLNVLLIVNSDKNLIERSYFDNTYSNTFNLGNVN